jgi:dTDP-4-amino-4,6-dideoxygalactose transaminase
VISETTGDGAVKVIGGLFGFSQSEVGAPVPPPFFGGNRVLLANARSGVWLAAKLLKTGRVWVPSYLCPTILDGVRAAGIEAEFYDVDDNLQVPSMAWADAVSRGDLVVLIDFFGWPCDPSSIAVLRQRGAWILEDACQALLSDDTGKDSDFTLVSPRKFLGVPDGAVLFCKSTEIELNKVALQDPPQEWWFESFAAMLLRREFDLYGKNRAWLDHYHRFETGHPIGAYAMSQLSEALLLYKFDYQDIARRRRDNYQVLANRLGRFGLFPELPEGVVPLGFPARFPERDRLREALFKVEIYPPVHWQFDGIVPRQFVESHQLSAEIMTLPCDQRYDSEDMERMAQSVLKEVQS